jgi:DNA-binding NtrC family response regulator
MMEPKLRPPPPARVLIVEDEPRLREALVRACGQMGYEARAAGSAEEALRFVREAEFGVVLLDLNLPGLDGIGFFERLRSEERRVEVIILTGYGSLESARQTIALDVSDYLTKPFHLGEIEAALEKARRRLTQKREPVLPEKPWTPSTPASTPSEARRLEDVERETILAALERYDGKRSAAAAELGISERTLYYRLKQWQEKGR